MIPIKLIVAHDENSVMGNGLKMPTWHLTDDFLLNFKPKTLGCALIMGKNTALSLGKPLPGRINIVITHNPLAKNLPLGFTYVYNIEQALDIARRALGHTIWIIGGAQIYALVLNTPGIVIKELHITKVHGKFEGDIIFPAYNKDIYRLSSRVPFKKRVADGEKDRGNSHDFDIEVYENLLAV